jgi:hypothetical protein
MQTNNETVYKLSTDAVLALQAVFMKCLAEELSIDAELRTLEFKYASSNSPHPTLTVLNPPRTISIPTYNPTEEDDAS